MNAERAGMEARREAGEPPGLSGGTTMGRRRGTGYSHRRRGMALALPLMWMGGCLGPGTLNEDRCDYADAQQVLAGECLPCHSAGLQGAARGGAPEGVDFDTDDAAQAHAESIRQVLQDASMPPGIPLSPCSLNQLSTYLDALDPP